MYLFAIFLHFLSFIHDELCKNYIIIFNSNTQYISFPMKEQNSFHIFFFFFFEI